ncbi:hypothetical protein VTH82DRAFT_8461 [Thermothelomyces myriococcoides]
MSGKKPSKSQKWDSLDSLVYLAGGWPHDKAREYVERKGLEKSFREKEYTGAEYRSSGAAYEFSRPSTKKGKEKDTRREFHFTRSKKSH